MRRTNALIAASALVVGLLAGWQFRAAPSAADAAATPPSDMVSGFESVGLVRLPVAPEAPDESNTSIEVRGADGVSSPAWVSLARYTYQPGGYINLPYSYPAPVAYYVESGTLTLEAAGPNVRVVEVQRAATPESWQGMTVQGATAGVHYEVTADNYVYAMDGNLGPTRNDGNEPLVVLAVFLQTLEGDESEDSTSVAATPSS